MADSSLCQQIGQVNVVKLFSLALKVGHNKLECLLKNILATLHSKSLDALCAILQNIFPFGSSWAKLS